MKLLQAKEDGLASQNAGLHEVPVVILDVDDVKSLEFAIVENVQRQDLNPIEEARGYQKLVDDFEYNQEKLSQIYWKKQKLYSKFIKIIRASQRNT